MCVMPEAHNVTCMHEHFASTHTMLTVNNDENSSLNQWAD